MNTPNQNEHTNPTGEMMDEDIQLLKDRVAKLEQEVGELKSNSVRQVEQPWWERIAGRFENDPAFEEIVRLGREHREAQTAEEDG